jgi:formate hydrogenlyase subunit 3/multisubunit Na+/H+ antiporter MnhD subunit
VDLRSPLEHVGFTLQLEPGAVPILVASLLLTAGAFLLATCVSQGRSFVPFALVLAAGYAALALLTTGPVAPLLLGPLFLVGLSNIGVFILQAGRIVRPAGPLRALLPPTLAFPLFLIAAWYIEQIPLNPQDNTAAHVAAQLLALGMILLLAPAPLHGAQPAIAQSAPPVVTALLTLLYQLSLLHLLYRAISAFPFVPQEAALETWLIWAGLATAVWGGVAAAGTNHAGRLWGYTALHDWGLLVLVLAVPGIRSWPLVLFLFGLRSVSMLTAAAGLSVLEQHTGDLSLDGLQGAGGRLPWNSAAFLLGGLGLAGFPLSAGFTGHWAALQIVAESDWRPAAVVLIASGGAIFGFTRMARALFGPLQNRYLLREQPLSVALAALILLLSVSLAVIPQLLDGPISRALLAFSG